METVSFSILVVLAMVVFSNFANGTLGDWLSAKFLNAAAPTRDYADANKTKTPVGGAGIFSMSCPVAGAEVLSVWGDDRDGGARSHQGIDLGAPAGTPVGAAANGRVVRAGDAGGNCGLRVAIAHQRGVETLYCHLQSVDTVAGRRVTQGQTIGKVGTTGNAAGGAAHVHFEVHNRNVPEDPAGWLPVGCGGSGRAPGRRRAQ